MECLIIVDHTSRFLLQLDGYRGLHPKTSVCSLLVFVSNRSLLLLLKSDECVIDCLVCSFGVSALQLEKEEGT